MANAVDQLHDMSKRLTVHKSECDLVAQTMNNLYEWLLQLCGSLQKTSPDAWSTMIRGETTLQALSNAGLTEASMAGVMKALDEITKFNLENKDPKERVSNGVFNTCEKVLIPIKFLLLHGDRTGRDYRIFLTKTIDDDKTATTQRSKSTLTRLPVNEIVKVNFSAQSCVGVFGTHRRKWRSLRRALVWYARSAQFVRERARERFSDSNGGAALHRYEDAGLGRTHRRRSERRFRSTPDLNRAVITRSRTNSARV